MPPAAKKAKTLPAWPDKSQWDSADVSRAFLSDVEQYARDFVNCA